MLPKIHLFLGIIFILCLHLIFPELSLINLSIILFSSFLIDIDHYFYYIIKEKNLSLLRCRRWYGANLKRTLSLPTTERKKIYSGFYLFHGIEWIIILFLCGKYIHPLFYFISLGFMFHWIMDTPDEYCVKGTLDKISLFWNFYRRKKLKSLGLLK
jgi:hypothetical protein